MKNRAKILKKAMEEKKIRYTDLAEKLNVPASTVTIFFKTLQTGRPRKETLQKYCDILEVNIEDLK